MKNCKFAVITLVGILISVEGCAHAQRVEESPSGCLYIDSVFKFSFRAPKLVTDSTPTSRVMVFADSDNFIMAMVDANNTRTPSEYREWWRASLDSGMNVTLDTTLAVDGRKAILWEYNATIPGQGPGAFIEIDVFDKGKVVKLLSTSRGVNHYNDALLHALMSLKFF